MLADGSSGGDFSGLDETQTVLIVNTDQLPTFDPQMFYLQKRRDGQITDTATQTQELTENQH